MEEFTAVSWKISIFISLLQLTNMAGVLLLYVPLAPGILTVLSGPYFGLLKVMLIVAIIITLNLFAVWPFLCSNAKLFISRARQRYGRIVWLVYGVAQVIALFVSKGNYFVTLPFSGPPSMLVSLVRLRGNYEDALAVIHCVIIQSLLAFVEILAITNGDFRKATAAIIPIIIALHAIVPCPDPKDPSEDCLEAYVQDVLC